MDLSGYDNIVAAKPDLARRSDSGRTMLSLGVRGLACVRGERVLFSGIEFNLTGGQLLLIAGANGSGKTSLLKMLCGFIYADEGEVLWRGTDIKSCMDDYLAEMHYIGHNNGIKSGLTCVENLKVAQVLAGSSGPGDFLDVLRQYSLENYADTPAQMLSSGQRRRLALARLSVSNAVIWILDEPFTSLDEKGKAFMQQRCMQQLGSGGIIAMTSHEPVYLDKITPVTIRL